MALFSAPARIDDFSRSPKQAELAAGWDAVVDHWLTEAAKTPHARFFNPHAVDAPSGGADTTIPWDGFPLAIKSWFENEPDGNTLQYRCADTLRPFEPGGRPLRAVRDNRLAEELATFRRQQDEYCEWHVERADGEITGIQVTSEGPEYWRFLMSGTAPFFAEDDDRRTITSGDPDLVLRLYREHVSPAVQPEDLVWAHDVAYFDTDLSRWRSWAKAGDYNVLNRWTTTHGAMHLTHAANTLGAEVTLAAEATIQRSAELSARAMICCSGYGGASRSSDPTIGFGVNQGVADGNLLTLADPVGLYIGDVNTGALSDPDAWTPQRHWPEKNFVLRGRIDVPPGGLTVGGVPLQWGGQIADLVQMVLVGHVVPKAGGPIEVQECVGKCCTHPEKPDLPVVVDIPVGCAEVNWERVAPFMPPEPDSPVLAGEASPPLTETERDAEIAPAPTRRPSHR